MSQKLQGKIALVVGAGGSIGNAITKRLAGAGARVAAADVSRQAADTLATSCSAEGWDVRGFVVDVADEASVQSLVAAVIDAFGRIDILQYNAAATDPADYGRDLTLLELPTEVWDKSFAVNVRGAMLAAKYVVPRMLENPSGGVIINTSSASSELPSPLGQTAYGASKAALNTLTRYIAAQYGPSNIRCNAVLPGLVMTDAARRYFTTDEIDAVARLTMLNKVSDPEDIAATIHFLVSDDARMISGQLVRVDGGLGRPKTE